MKNLIFCLVVSAISLTYLPINSYSKNLTFTNRIEGQVFDQGNTPVSDAFVELLNEVNSMIARTQTTSSGRFTFDRLTTGRFIVKVLPLGKNLMSDTKEVEISSIRNGASNVEYVDFYLRIDKRGSQALDGEPPEAIFAQDIPENAQKLYESGVRNLESNKDAGLTELEEAIKIFPNYFNALNRLGKEYVARKNYGKAYPYFLKAIDVNSRSFSSYYQLGFAFYQLKQIPAAIEAVKASLVIDASNINANLLYGTLLRLNGAFQDAEKTLLNANILGKGKVPDVHMQLALLYNRLSRNQDAINELETYLKLEPKSTERKNIEDTIAKLKGSMSKTN